MIRRLWLLLPLAVIPAAWVLLGNDLPYFLIWWLTLAAGGWLVWPLAAKLFPGGDAGYLLARPLGLILSTFALWTLSYMKILPFRRCAIVAVLLVLGTAAWLGRRGWRSLAEVWADPKNLRRCAAGELLFGAALLFWSFIRGIHPEIDGLEKFMDVGFMNTLWRTDYLPALDMWLSGGSINYYYYGQYVFTFVAKLANIRPEIAYNLSLASTFALAVSLSYTAASQLVALLRRHLPGICAAAAGIGGLLAAWLVCLAGNGHSFWYDLASPGHRLLTWAGKAGLVGGYTENSFWFADSTRFIGYNPNTADKTIHEFPFYSFLVADLHAHLINLAFVLLAIAGLIRLIDSSPLRQSAAECRAAQQKSIDSADAVWHRDMLRDAFSRLKATVRCGPLLLVILLLAVAMMGNYWDFAIYFMLSALVLIVVNFRGHGKIRPAFLPVFIIQCVLILIPFLAISQPVLAVLVFLAVLLVNSYLTVIFGDALTLTGVQLSWIFFLAHLLTLPFSSSFEPISKKIALAELHTPFWQLAILWGPHILAGVILIIFICLTVPRAPARVRQVLANGAPTKDSGSGTEAVRWLARLIRLHNPADLMAMILTLGGLLLILIPELVYVVDIYSGEFKRANTMFKFTYQAFVLLALAWSYALVRLVPYWVSCLDHPFAPVGVAGAPLRRKRPRTGRAWLSGLACLALIVSLLLPAWYTPLSMRQWVGELRTDRYAGLDGLLPLSTKNSAQIEGVATGELAADYAAIQWLNENVVGQPVILEAAGESYTDYGRISAFTGLPAVIGWETHEWLWRTGRSTPDAYGSVVRPRQEAVRLMYTTTDQSERLALLDEYKVVYIVVGDLERTRYSEALENGSRHSLVQESLLRQLGDVVFEQGSLAVIKLNIAQANG